MSSINIVAVSGRLTRDAEVRATKSGSMVMNFSVAVNERRKNDAGEWEDRPTFVDCVVFGRRCEGLVPHMTRGRLVFCSGRLHQSVWTDQDGRARSKLELYVEEIVWQPDEVGRMRDRMQPGRDLSDESIPF